MDVAKLYDEIVSENYDQDCFQLLNKSRAIVISQIQRNTMNFKAVNILDLALGTGEILLGVKKSFPKANFSGIDVSQKMIDIAKNKLQIATFHDDARNVEKYVEPNSIDIAFMHFVLSYVPPEEIIPVASRVLRQGGLLSVASSTYNSFKQLQNLSKQLMPEKDLKSYSHTPQTPDELKKILNQNKLEIIEDQDLRQTVDFFSAEELYSWGMKSGWFTDFLSRLTTNEQTTLLSSAKEYFPISDEFQVSILLTRKI